MTKRVERPAGDSFIWKVQSWFWPVYLLVSDVKHKNMSVHTLCGRTDHILDCRCSIDTGSQSGCQMMVLGGGSGGFWCRLVGGWRGLGAVPDDEKKTQSVLSFSSISS